MTLAGRFELFEAFWQTCHFQRQHVTIFLEFSRIYIMYLSFDYVITKIREDNSIHKYVANVHYSYAMQWLGITCYTHER